MTQYTVQFRDSRNIPCKVEVKANSESEAKALTWLYCCKSNCNNPETDFYPRNYVVTKSEILVIDKHLAGTKAIKVFEDIEHVASAFNAAVRKAEEVE